MKMNAEKPLSELLEFSILNIDKPSGPTSFDVSDFVRKKMNEIGIRKTSHFGTLDPKVTGVLPIALNRACKLTGFFLGHDKEYIGIMRIHEERNIQKIGNFLSHSNQENLKMEEIQEIINKKFLGRIKQTPPVKSRVKRVEREREVKRFEILEESENGKDLLFTAEVQGGTYIRKLIDDLGKEIGGAHMLELRRIRAGIFEEEKIINLYDFEKAVDEYNLGNEKRLREILIPAEEALKKVFPFVEVKKDSVKNLLTGKPIQTEDLINKKKFDKEEIVCIFSEDKFIGVYKIVNDGELIAKPEFVLQPIK